MPWLKKILKKIDLEWLEKNVKIWGVEIESNLPPEFIITDHAFLRIKTRTNYDDKKIKKLVVKAWFSKEPVSKKFLSKIEDKIKRYGPTHYRSFLGNVYVFRAVYSKRLGHFQKKLVTVYKPGVIYLNEINYDKSNQ